MGQVAHYPALPALYSTYPHFNLPQPRLSSAPGSPSLLWRGEGPLPTHPPVSHRRTRESVPAVARWRPSGQGSTHVTLPECARRAMADGGSSQLRGEERTGGAAGGGGGGGASTGEVGMGGEGGGKYG